MAGLLKNPKNQGLTLTETTLIDDPEGFGFTAQTSVFIFDVTLQESHQTKVTWTEHPVESGARVTDRGVLEQFVLSVTGYVSATPILESLRQEDRLTDSALAIQEFAERKAILSVDTSLAIYDNMVIESLDIPREFEDGQAIRISLGLKQIVVVQSQEVEIPAEILARPVRAGGADKDKNGPQTGTDDSAEDPQTAAGKATNDRLQSQAFRLRNSLLN
jgi:hypothetical protein